MIEIKDLPLRAKQLNTDDVAKVFGGCKKAGEDCNDAKECCYGHSGSVCEPSWGGRMTCKEITYY